MQSGIPLLLGQVLVISLSGVLAPGPVTAATIAAGTRSRHAGSLIALGHGIIEFPLMLAITLGAGALLTARAFQIGAGLAGGASLVAMGMMMLWGIRKVALPQQPPAAANPLWTGMVLTAANPYFFIWWATVGLALATQAIELGILAFVLFAIVHWLCDLFWLEAISFASHRGAHLMGINAQKILLCVCGATMLLFGLWFLRDVIHKLGAAAAGTT